MKWVLVRNLRSYKKFISAIYTNAFSLDILHITIPWTSWQSKIIHNLMTDEDEVDKYVQHLLQQQLLRRHTW